MSWLRGRKGDAGDSPENPEGNSKNPEGEQPQVVDDGKDKLDKGERNSGQDFRESLKYEVPEKSRDSGEKNSESEGSKLPKSENSETGASEAGGERGNFERSHDGGRDEGR